MTPKEYEQAVLERFRTMFPPPRFTVKHDLRLRGRKTNVWRQLDVCVFETGSPNPGLLIEAKCHKRPIDSVRAGATIALMRDVGEELPAVMVATSGFSPGARNYLAAEGVANLTIPLTEAQGLRWIPLLEQAFAVDHEFREVSGHLIEALRKGDAAPFLDETGLPYEEWLAVFAVGQSQFSRATGRILKVLARQHFDNTVRFNAVQLLDEAAQLKPADIATMLAEERDPDTVELLQGLLE